MNMVPHVPHPVYDEYQRHVRLAYVTLSERDQALLRDVEAIIKPELSDIVEEFYQHLLSFQETRNVFADEAMVARLKEAQKAYLLQAVHGPYDEVYFARRWQIGYIHNVIKLEPRWYIGAFQLYHRILYPRVMARFKHDPEAGLERILALDKVMNLDEQLGVESYMVHYEATMEQLRELNRRVQEASAAKSQFLANMSHEFRTPLNAILGFTEVLEDEAAEALNPDQRSYLVDIHHAGEVLLRLVNEVLDLSKVEAGRLELLYETFPVAQVIREVVTGLRSSAESKGLTLRHELAPDLGAITADLIRFKQILYNLLANAVKFTDMGSITVGAVREGGVLHLSVTDTGIGIRPEDRERIFEPFVQAETTGGHALEGAGLGLAVSKRLTEAHGGRISVDSAPGRGSTFHVWLPVAPATAARRKLGDKGDDYATRDKIA